MTTEMHALASERRGGTTALWMMIAAMLAIMAGTATGALFKRSHEAPALCYAGAPGGEAAIDCDWFMAGVPEPSRDFRAQMDNRTVDLTGLLPAALRAGRPFACQVHWDEYPWYSIQALLGDSGVLSAIGPCHAQRL